MQILILSDSHGDSQILTDLVSRYSDQVDYYIHCGDSELSDQDTIWNLYTTVQGNMDFYPFATEAVLDTDQGKIVIVHGHLHQVKQGDQTLVSLAKEKQADIVCYGHTHVMDCHETEGVLIINPGSIRLPRGEYPKPSYAILTIDKAGNKSVAFYNRDNNLIPEDYWQ
ncbi:metallophosphoesterase [Aerococcus kribbianus]|uniref:Phosphoesterase n=1 Tax=Aerococcus kribbianus TaxID=2999064 RepID=A0A9X3FMD1_9LACT|nr:MULTISPECIES: metallophosphoesterase [unclassified Aerococcus]MCZ0717040.1 metallophosphoesterase [Aerococcus sp. YH-aer221]MCZ0725328.1 metallophosphoesterase [Aerococcus sp. YH-aer222]